MFIASLCDHAGNCRMFGPFLSDLAARDWGMEAQELGFLPHTVITVKGVEEPQYEELGISRLEEPLDLGYDPGL